jgi:hypothetical protein
VHSRSRIDLDQMFSDLPAFILTMSQERVNGLCALVH